MPFIDAKFSVKIPAENEKSLAEKITNAITLIPGKSPSSLMVNLQDECKLYFRGTNENPCAIFEVKIFGSSTKDAYTNLTARLCEIAKEELGIEGNNVYVKFDEVSLWGMDSFMF